LTQEALVCVVHAFDTYRIVYCNSLLHGIADYDFNSLQHVEKGAVHLMSNTRKILAYHYNCEYIYINLKANSLQSWWVGANHPNEITAILRMLIA